MSKANFWFDQTGDCQNPGQAIAWLQSVGSPRYLSDWWTSQTPWQISLGNRALLMMGTTEKLREALLEDIKSGINAVDVPTFMNIWYVRRRAKLETKSVVIIADKDQYWGPSYKNTLGQKGWKEMCRGIVSGHVGLKELADNILPEGQGKTAEW